MTPSIIKSALIALALLTSAGLALADDPQPPKAKQSKAAPEAKTTAKSKKPAAPQAEPVDINSASKEQLKKLPGIGDAEAEKIIAGRPYLSKAHLQTHNVISPGLYLTLSPLVVARQKDAKFIKAPKK